MRQIASLVLAFALFAAPVALAADSAAPADKASCCAKKGAATAADKKCDPATCKDHSKCTPEERAKCAAAADKKCDPATCKDHKNCTPEEKAKCAPAADKKTEAPAPQKS